MTTAKRILPYTLTLAGFALLEILISAFLVPHVSQSAFLTELFPLVSSVLAVIPPFLAVGTSVTVLRTRPFSHAVLSMAIFAGIDLFAQIPLSLVAYSPADSAPYGLILASYMITSAVTSLLFLAALLLGYALFMQGKEDLSRDQRVFALSDRGARPVLLAAVLLTLYHVIREIVDMIAYAKERLYVISVKDVLFMLLYLVFFLLLGVFAFAVGRLSERILPPLFADVEEDSDESEDYENQV